MFFNTLVAAAGFAALSTAHVVISEPKPFAVPALHNGPIQPDGSDFPCQSTGTYQTGGVTNVMPLGSRQPLAFVGTAVHGGGSCQVSITYDTAPTKNSVWKVIHSIEGGCPARDTPGNLGNDPNFKVPFDYSFPLPTDIPTGNGTVAWTWLNKVGNREFYMNCAPVTLTGTSGDKSNYDALPDMLVANIGNGCTTEEGKDYKYPNAGKSVQSFARGELALPIGNCGPKGPSGGNGGGQGGGSGSNPPKPGGGDAPTPATAIPGGVFVTVTDGETAPTAAPAPPPVVGNPPATPDVPAAPEVPATPPKAPATPPSSGGGNAPASGGGGFAPGTACSPEGLWNCIGGSSFQRCASGSWSAVMAVAGGTTCKSGSSSTLEMMSAVAKKARRVARSFRA
ncbi:putative chitin domain 3 protein [Podospora conica]|nr:putative chitin domain 3 protein [Schizothecium conicum]